MKKVAVALQNQQKNLDFFLRLRKSSKSTSLYAFCLMALISKAFYLLFIIFCVFLIIKSLFFSNNQLMKKKSADSSTDFLSLKKN